MTETSSFNAMILAPLLALAAAPPPTGTADPNPKLTLPAGQHGIPPIANGGIDPSLFDGLASFDFTHAPMSYTVPPPSPPSAQRLTLSEHTHSVIVPIDGAPQFRAMHFDGIQDPQEAASAIFESNSFLLAARKTLEIAWDGQFHPHVATIEMHVGIAGFADLAVVVFRKGKVTVVTTKGEQPLASYIGAESAASGGYSPSQHHVLVRCDVVVRSCTIAFSQFGKTTTSAPITLIPIQMQTPAGSRRVSVKLTWPKTELAPDWYDLRRVIVTGDAPNGG